MPNWTVQAADDLYHISNWGDGYFGINENGKMIVLPVADNPEVRICIQDVVDELVGQKAQFPVVIRFHDILRDRVKRLNNAFKQAIEDQDYGGVYRGVYPIKVNQMREVVDEITDAGKPFHYGLEAGSKAELMAVLSFETSDEALTICNGYKDEDFLRLALLGNKLGRNVVVVIEKFSEIAPLLRLADEMNVRPIIGLRIKMRIKTEGRWSSSSGERAKFGLTISEIIKAIDYITEQGYLDCIKLLHFHVGSQLSDSRFVQGAIDEATRIYARLVKRDVPLEYLDIGGGLAVDYDGSHSSQHTSMNYTMEEYAANVVAGVKQVCELEDVPAPNLVSESGRAITAHHSCVIMRVIGEITSQGVSSVITEESDEEHYLISNMRELMRDLNEGKSPQDIYNQVTILFEDTLSAFKLGVIRLEELAVAETLHWKIIRTVYDQLDPIEAMSEEFKELGITLASQYLCNFSLFQSAADSWAIEQLLPVAPLAHHDEEPTVECSLADITCDSDGKICRFIGDTENESTLLLHANKPGEPYYIGLFLTGAYQDVMGDMHNLFGRLHEAHVFCDDDDPTDFYIEEFVKGSSASQVLRIMQYNPKSMASTVKKKVDERVRNGQIKSREGVALTDFYEKCLHGYTYLRPQ